MIWEGNLPEAPPPEENWAITIPLEGGGKGVTALRACAPATWKLLASTLGEGAARSIVPISWDVRNGDLVIIVSADLDTAMEAMKAFATARLGHSMRRPLRSDLRHATRSIPLDIEMLVTCSHPGLDEARRLSHVSVDDPRLPANRGRFEAVRQVADLIHQALPGNATLRPRILGANVQPDGVVVAIETDDVPEVRILRALGTQIAPAGINAREADSLDHAFRKRAAELTSTSRGHRALNSKVIPPLFSGFPGIVCIGILTILVGPLFTIVPIFLATIFAFIYTIWRAEMSGSEPAAARQAAALPTAPAVPLLAHDAWSDLLRLAPRQNARISASKAACERFLLLADGRALDAQSVETLNSVTVHLPRLIAEAQEIARHADPEEARSVGMRAIAAAERIAAAADAGRDHLLAAARDRFSTSATFIESRHPDDLLSLPRRGETGDREVDPDALPDPDVRDDPNNYFEARGDL